QLLVFELLRLRGGFQLRSVFTRFDERRQRLREGLRLPLPQRLRLPPVLRRKIWPLLPWMPVPPQPALLAAKPAIGSHAVWKPKLTCRTKMNFAQRDPQFIATQIPNRRSNIAYIFNLSRHLGRCLLAKFLLSI